ncbi:hypothetical protein GCM10022223_53880 [Kineosporia mesophila]|uniref:GGDEF domain-containing protein n=1 Tax=Kineosporia mesophila TaxID=566012 RepID=A0ABP7ACQ4_9ACTN|nr:diguanylate cyclase [Kineosporia mesophila]MCD5351234.1 diguanylate cyclase [Kineosporia mesophila]
MRQGLWRSALFALLFAAALGFGRLPAVGPGTSLSVACPAAGVAVVWFAVQRDAGTWWWDIVLLGVISSGLHLATESSIGLAGSLAVGDVVQLLLFTVMFRRWCPHAWGAGGEQALIGMRQLFRLTGAAVVASAGSALIVLRAIGAVTTIPTWQAALIWILSNSIAIVLIAAAGFRVGCLLSAAQRRRKGRKAEAPDLIEVPFHRPGGRGAAELVMLLISTSVIYELVFYGTSLPIAFLTQALTVWMALRFDTVIVVIHNLLTGTFAVFLTLAGHGPFATLPTTASRALVVLTFTGLVAVVGLALAMSRDERDVLLSRVQDQADLAQAHAQHMETLARASRALAGAEDAREAICRAAREISGADGAYLLEPQDGDMLVSTATGGMPLPPVRLHMSAEGSQAAVVLREGRMVFAANLESSTQATPRIRAEVNARSALWQPVFRAGKPVAVICLFFKKSISTYPPHVPPMLETLAAEAASAIERADFLDRLARAAERDSLTNVANRRRWDQALATEIARAQRTGKPLTVALLDLDHFKRYNDRHGHLAGDDLLREFARAAEECLREIDTLARWGGEEFAVALPSCTAHEALVVAERIRAVVPNGQTCTVGLAEWTAGLSAEETMRRADEVLYQGKQAGRDKTIIHPARTPVESC